jgi:hypothetical protein
VWRDRMRQIRAGLPVPLMPGDLIEIQPGGSRFTMDRSQWHSLELPTLALVTFRTDKKIFATPVFPREWNPTEVQKDRPVKLITMLAEPSEVFEAARWAMSKGKLSRRDEPKWLRKLQGALIGW